MCVLHRKHGKKKQSATEMKLCKKKSKLESQKDWENRTEDEKDCWIIVTILLYTH